MLIFLVHARSSAHLKWDSVNLFWTIHISPVLNKLFGWPALTQFQNILKLKMLEQFMPTPSSKPSTLPYLEPNNKIISLRLSNRQSLVNHDSKKKWGSSVSPVQTSALQTEDSKSHISPAHQHMYWALIWSKKKKMERKPVGAWILETAWQKTWQGVRKEGSFS